MIKIQQRIGQLEPFIGSGKIKRRVKIVEHKRESKRKEYDPIDFAKKLSVEKKRDLKNVDFHSEKIKIVFLHWNTKGKPFTIHQIRKTKLLLVGLNGAKRALNKYGIRRVVQAIDLCHEMFNADWFKFDKKRYGIKGLSLGNFFKYNIDARREIKRRNNVLYNADIISWFQECLKGENYLREKYSLHFKDENKRLTRSLKKVWLTYSQNKLSPDDKNALVICSKKAVEFARLNEHLGISAEGVIMTLDNMINKFHIWEPKYISWIINDIFWNKQLPRELVRYGTVSNIDRNKIQLLPWDKK